jgi:DNA-binding XRE family transcriptional regulator
MEVYERVDEVIKKMGRSRTHLAKQLDIKQTTFNNWFTRDRQDNLLPILFKILELFPHISREWLFFGEGAMVKSEMEEPLISQKREKELLLKIEQLSGLLIKMENHMEAR